MSVTSAGSEDQRFASYPTTSAGASHSQKSYVSHSDVRSVQASSIASEKQAFREAFKAAAPTMPGTFVWGIVSGMAMVKAGLTLWQALGMTFIVYAGSAQLAALPLIAANASIWMVFITALVVNLRFVIFAAAIGPHFTRFPCYKRIWYGYLNGDIMMGLFPQRFPAATLDQPQGKSGYFTGIAYSNWCMWQSGSVAGILLASLIPQDWGIGLAGTLALLAIMIPLIINAAALAGVAAASIVAVVAADLPCRLGLLLAIIIGMAVAITVDTVIDKNKRGDGA